MRPRAPHAAGRTSSTAGRQHDPSKSTGSVVVRGVQAHDTSSASHILPPLTDTGAKREHNARSSFSCSVQLGTMLKWYTSSWQPHMQHVVLALAAAMDAHQRHARRPQCYHTDSRLYLARHEARASAIPHFQLSVCCFQQLMGAAQAQHTTQQRH
jgi:hypothetical protein